VGGYRGIIQIVRIEGGFLKKKRKIFTRNISLLAKLKNRAFILKQEAYALYIAARDPRLPWVARVFMGLVLAYAFSPIDLIPDFIPVLGYLDDLVIVPFGIAISLKMVPAQVMIDARKKAADLLQQGEPTSRLGVFIVIFLWLIILAAGIWIIVHSTSLPPAA
jgi:uncharacterized membrane protein YkvA (DUF1232 family)